MVDFKAAWDSYYPGHHPIGYMMRGTGAQYWLRFHSLPESKRYAETENERRILLCRQNELAEEILGQDVPCWLVQTCWGWSDRVNEKRVEITADMDMFKPCRDFGLTFSHRFIEETGEPDDEVISWNVYSTSTTWQSGKFDSLLLAIAADQVAPILWMSGSGAVFAPYDGGIDLFLAHRADVERLAVQHADWLPSHPLGL